MENTVGSLSMARASGSILWSVHPCTCRKSNASATRGKTKEVARARKGGKNRAREKQKEESENGRQTGTETERADGEGGEGRGKLGRNASIHSRWPPVPTTVMRVAKTKIWMMSRAQFLSGMARTCLH